MAGRTPIYNDSYYESQRAQAANEALRSARVTKPLPLPPPPSAGALPPPLYSTPAASPVASPAKAKRSRVKGGESVTLPINRIRKYVKANNLRCGQKGADTLKYESQATIDAAIRLAKQAGGKTLTKNIAEQAIATLGC